MSETWRELHDATVESIELRWGSGEAVIRLRTGDVMRPRRVLVASSVRRLGVDMKMPWGPSVSINEVRGPIPVGENVSLLEIEMQSGDVIQIEANGFRITGDE